MFACLARDFATTQHARHFFDAFVEGELGDGGTRGLAIGELGDAQLVMALAGLGGVAVRQASAFINQRNRYMVVMARNLYFHSMADNRGVMTLLADRAAEEDIKEEMLLYASGYPRQHVGDPERSFLRHLPAGVAGKIRHENARDLYRL